MPCVRLLNLLIDFSLKLLCNFSCAILAPFSCGSMAARSGWAVKMLINHNNIRFGARLMSRSHRPQAANRKSTRKLVSPSQSRNRNVAYPARDRSKHDSEPHRITTNHFEQVDIHVTMIAICDPQVTNYLFRLLLYLVLFSTYTILLDWLYTFISYINIYTLKHYYLMCQLSVTL